MRSTTILYVEDDLSLAYITKYNLEKAGYNVIHCDNGVGALTFFQEHQIHLCLFDVMLPGMDGFSLARQIRKLNQDVPIIFLTVKAMLEDKITGLQLGADDYLCKPFHLEELMLRIEVFLKRSKVHNDVTSAISIGGYIFDYPNLVLSIDQEIQQLTFKEAHLLQYLLERKNTVVKRDDILKTVWGDDDYFLGRSMDVFISRLRKYFAYDAKIKIENVHGVGFRFSIQEIQ